MTNIHRFQKSIVLYSQRKSSYYGYALFFGLLIAFGGLFYILWPEVLSNASLIKIRGFLDLKYAFLGFLIITLSLLFHEFLHGLIWKCASPKGSQNVRLKYETKYFIPYYQCLKPIRIKYYLMGLISPSLVLGLLPLIFSLLTNNVLLFFFGILNISNSIVDFMLIYLIYCEKWTNFVKDHPDENGCIIYRRINT